MKVCAAVVTFNRKRLLGECLDALSRQIHPVERVVVVDNASSDGTDVLMRGRDDLTYVRLERNAGGAGGFAKAVEVAREGDCDWIWLMDDDAEPRRDTLERLLRSPGATGPATALLAPAVVDPEGRIDTRHRGRWRRRPRPLPEAAYRHGGERELDYATFVGVLIRARAARAEEPPRREFFIWADDYEYSFRLRRQGALILVPESRIVHKDAGQAYANRRSRFWNRLPGMSYEPTPLDQFWRNLCGVRNYVWVKKEYEGQSALSATGTAAQFVLKALLYDPQPFRRIPWIVRFARAGRRGDFRNIEPQRWAEMSRS